MRTPAEACAPPLSASSMEPAHSISAIAQAIGRPKSTVWCELSRNSLPSGRYSPRHAAGAYQLRRRRDAWIARDRAERRETLHAGLFAKRSQWAPGHKLNLFSIELIEFGQFLHSGAEP